MNTARRLLTADHHRMILMMHSEGKTDGEISVWLRESEHVDMSRLAVNRLRRRLQGQAPPSSHTPQLAAAAGAAALAELEASADDLSVSELVDALLRARWAVAVQASRVGDGTAATSACRDFIGLAGLAERFPLENDKPTAVPHLPAVTFSVKNADGTSRPLPNFGLGSEAEGELVRRQLGKQSWHELSPEARAELDRAVQELPD